MIKGVFPGSFDPFTKGHEAIVEKSLPFLEKLYIAIGQNSKKNALFSLEKRIEHIQSLFKNNTKIEIIEYQGLTSSLCSELNANYIIRGLRNSLDFEYEKSIALMNTSLSKVETIFLLSDPEHLAVNSSIVREIYMNGGDISNFVTSSNLLA